MKKIIVLLLLFVPMTSFGIPTVRKLGSPVSASAAANASGQTSTKIVPARAAATPQVKASSTTPSRIGTVRAQSLTTKPAGAISSSTTRFPVVSAGKAFSTISSPQASNTNKAVVADVDTEAIVGAVIEEIDTRKLYVNESNPKFDTVGVVQSGEQLPNMPNLDGRVYMWVEVED